MKRAARKKFKKQFQVGDVVTWGLGASAHRVVEVQEFGVVVDCTSQDFGMLFVSYDNNNRDKSGRGPVRHSDLEPDKIYPVNSDERLREYLSLKV